VLGMVAEIVTLGMSTVAAMLAMEAAARIAATANLLAFMMNLLDGWVIS